MKIRKIELNDLYSIAKLVSSLPYINSNVLNTYLGRVKNNPMGNNLLMNDEMDVIGAIFTEVWSVSDLTFEGDIRRLASIEGGASNVDHSYRNTLHVPSLLIHPNYRNSGYGSLLLNRTIEEIVNNNSEIEQVISLNRKKNEASIKLYRKNGFLKLITINSFYSNGDDAIVMVKKVAR